jgi:prepilin-type N-terminal cleavage/methylation domain-containing protein
MRSRVRRGFTLVEVLIAIAVTSILMVGLASAVDAFASAMRANDAIAVRSNAARAAMDRMLSETRTCAEPIVGATSLELKPENFDEKRTYAFNATTKQLTMTVQQNIVDVPNPVVVVARDVSSATFRTDGKSVSITLVIGTGANAVTLSGSATPRRFLTYQ